VNGAGVSGLMEPEVVMDMGNAGTSTRLLMGLVSPFNFTSFFSGDASLRKRPMRRVFEPISQIGAQVISRKDQFLPTAIIGAKNPMPIHYEMRVASAQVKSAIILAALNIEGTTTIIEPTKCRDHTEIMMRSLGLDIKSEDINNGLGTKISVSGGQEFNAQNFLIPGDISSAAFLIVAALITPNSKLKITNVGINPLRDGIVTTLKEMGGNIELLNKRLVCGEEVADIAVEYSQLKGINVPASRAPIMIDEYPILAIAAANAKGVTKMEGLAELKVKESNRLGATAQGLISCGVEVKEGEDSLEVTGGITQPKDLVKIETFLDHRIAMSFLIMGLKIDNGLEIDNSNMINTSFPSFTKLFENFGINFKKTN
ncbi:MAG: 3-phosphoshikimate 1-carboxyvinyltransferase, partial [Proteobacteria bacterium]|nr:3-phosphoshikimate 1-carboxyvinyltransferase [Pseudomonadota bacterium]